MGGNALLEQHLVAHVVAEDSRKAGARLYQFGHFQKEFFRVLFADAHGQGGLDHLDVDARLKHEIGQRIDRVPAVGVQAAQRDVLEGAEAGIMPGGGLVPVPDLLAHLDPQAFDDFQGFLVAEAPLPVFFIERQQILVQQAGGIPARVALDEQAHKDEIDHLQRLMQGFRRVAGQMRADPRDALKIRTAFWPDSGHLRLGFPGVALAKNGKAFAADNHRTPEIPPGEVFDRVEVQSGQFFLGPAPDAVETQGQDQLRQGGHHVPRHAFDLDVIIAHAAHGHHFAHVLRGPGVPEIPQSLAPPVGIHLLPVEFFLLLADLVRVLRTGAHGVQLIVKPVVGQLGIDVDAPRHGPGIAHDEFVGLDGDGFGGAVLLEGPGSADDHGFAFRGLENPRLGQSPFDADAGPVGEKLALEPPDPFQACFLGE